MPLTNDQKQNHSIVQNLRSQFKLDEDNVDVLAENARDFAVYKGLLKCTEDHKYDPFQFCLLPSMFPRQRFMHMKNIQPIMNHILHQIAHSPDFLKTSLESLIEADEFTANIWRVYETVLTEGVSQPFSLTFTRCDYMLEERDQQGLKQIESNTFAVAFSNMAPLASDIHRFVFNQLEMSDECSKLPENRVMSSFAKAMVSAWEHYGKKKAGILFIVADGHIINVCDQRGLEFKMWEMNNNVRVLRRTFKELAENAILKEKKLFVDGYEVAVAYYRWGYSPSHYETEDWAVRLLVERSTAIKIPSAAYHLAGMKRVQYQLTLPGVLEKFLPKGVDPALIRQVFAHQYTLDMNEEGNRAMDMGIQNPHEYVLKPEREGGGNNIYGEEIRDTLKSLGQTKSRNVYILMEKINPAAIPNCIVPSSGRPRFTNITMEVGIYGLIMGTADDIHYNEESGFVVKTKEMDVDEGGLCRCVGALGSPYLV